MMSKGSFPTIHDPLMSKSHLSASQSKKSSHIPSTQTHHTSQVSPVGSSSSQSQPIQHASTPHPQDVKVHLPHCEIAILAEKQRKLAASLQKAKKRKKTASQHSDDASSSSSSSSSNSSSSSSNEAPNKKARPHTVYTFGNVPFSSFKKAMDYCKDVFEQPISEFYPGDREFEILQDIFKRVAAYQPLQFTAIGFKKGEKGKGPFCKYPSFYFKTQDQVAYPVNYRECLKANPTQCRVEPTYKTAFYNAIRVFLGKYRSMYFKTTGNNNNNGILHGGPILTKKNSEVVYRGATFDQILDNFLNEHGYTVDDLVGKYMVSPNRNKADLVDPILKDQWINYHSKHSLLDIVPKQRPTKEKKQKPQHEVQVPEDPKLSLPEGAVSEVSSFCQKVNFPTSED
jgi:hypothetical protein